MLDKYFRTILTLSLISFASSSAQIKNGTLETTFWASTDADGLPVVFQLEKTGIFLYIPATGVVSKGKWKQQEKNIQMEVNGGFVAFKGIVEGDRIAGTATSKRGLKWDWVGTKQPAVSATAAVNYPPLAVAARVEGYVIVDVEISKSGDVVTITSIKGHPLLKKVVEDAARNWRFRPVTEDQMRTARLSFTFHIVDNTKDRKKLISPVVLSPYQIIISREPPIIDRQYSQTSTGAAG